MNAGESETLQFSVNSSDLGATRLEANLVVSADENLANNRASTETVIHSAVTFAEQLGKISIEAESFALALPPSEEAQAGFEIPAWYLISSQTTNNLTQPDPDEADAQSASGNAYLEVLPDIRIDNSDENVIGISNFDIGGTGPTLQYRIYTEQTGKYYISARIRPNGTQDSTLHIGLNGQWPVTSQNLTQCAPDGTWKWTNTVSNDCSETSPAYINIDSPGLHIVNISQADDGLELDKLVFNLNDRTLPANLGDTTVLFDSSRALELSTSLSETDIKQGEETELAITVTNNSFDLIPETMIEIFVDESIVTNYSGFESCTSTSSSMICNFGALESSAVANANLFLSPKNTGEINISTRIIGLNTNDSTENSDVASKLIVQNTGGGGSLTYNSLFSVLLLLLITALSSRLNSLIGFSFHSGIAIRNNRPSI